MKRPKRPPLRPLLPSKKVFLREKDPDAAWGVTAVQVKTPVPRLPYPAHFHDPAQKKFISNISSLTQKDLGPRGQYKVYKVAEVALSPNCEICFGEDSWFSIRASLGEAYEPGSLNKD